MNAVATRPAPAVALRRGPGLAAGACAGAAVLFCGFVAAVGGADLFAFVRFCAAAWLALWLPGRALARRLAPRGSGLGVLYAVVYGMTLLAAVQCLAVRLHLPWLRWVLAAAGLAAFVYDLARAPGGPGAALRRVRLPAAGAVALWAALWVLFTFCSGALYPHPLAAGAVTPSQDLLWNIGNAEALCRNFPAQDLRFSGVRLSYHYLTDLVWGALASMSGAPMYDVYVFYTGPLFLAAELAAFFALSRVFFPGGAKRGVPRAFVGLVFGFSCLSMWKVFPDGLSRFGNTLLAHLVTNINAQATAVICLAGFVCALCRLGRHRRAGLRTWAGLFVSFGALCVAKGPQAALAVCALWFALVPVLLFGKGRRLQALGTAVALTLLFAAVYRVLYSAGTGSMEFSIFAMRDTLCYRLLAPYTDRLCALLPIPGYVWLVAIGILQAFCMLPFQLWLWLGTLPGEVRRIRRPDPARWFAHGMVGGGFTACLLFSHSSSSQIYFALAGMLFAGLLAAEPFARLLVRPGRRPFACLLGAAGALTTLCLVACYVGAGGARLAATVTGADLYGPSRVSPADEQAMDWLAENTGPDVMFATNRTSGTPEQTDAISNCYSAFSARQAYMEGWTYAMTNMGVDKEVLAYKQWINGMLFDGSTAGAELADLCRQEGIGCLVYAKAWPGAAPAGLTPDYENAEVAVYLIPDA